MKKSEKSHAMLTAADRAKAPVTGHSTRVALEVTDMPVELGKLLDKGLEDHFRDR